MAKFCTNCGAPLPEGAGFCPECGTKAPHAEKQPGIVIDAPPGSTVIISDKPPAPSGFVDPRTRSGVHSSSANRMSAGPSRSSAGRPGAAPVHSSRSFRPEQTGTGEGPRTGKGTRFLSFLLVLVMLAELGIAGFKYPGFLRKKDSPGGGTSVSVRPSATAAPVPTGSIGTQTGNQPEAVMDDEADSPFTEAIPLRYTPEQIASAPQAEAEVSWQEPAVRAGQVEVLLNSWNLEEETDRLIVKTLPELSAGEEGWCIRAYDLSLASGQHEFPTDVAITIPREPDGLLGGCVWYNEAEDRWEDVYSELTEDGTGYILYADHFSLFGEKTYKFDKDLLQLVESDGFTVNLKSGVLVLIPNHKKDNSMEWKVGIDWNRLWNQYQKKDKKDIDALEAKMKALYSASVNEVNRIDTAEMLNWCHDLTGKVGVAEGTFSGLGDFIEALQGAGLGPTFLALDLVLTNLKIITEVRRGSKDIYAMIRALPDACWKYKQEIVGVNIATLAAIFCANWVAAVIGILWWSGTSIYNQMTDRMLADVMSRPTLEEMYLQYYTGSCYRIDFGSSAVLKPSLKGSEFRYLTMDIGDSLETKDREKLTRAVNQRGLKITTSPLGVSPAFSAGWADAFTAILQNCSDDPEYLSSVLDDFYFNYAWAFWSMPEDKQEEYIHQVFWLGGEAGEAECLKLLRGASAQERIRITNAFVDRIKAGTYPILKDVIETLQHKSCEQLKREVEKQLLPILNTQLVFHVEDTALKEGETLRDSVYGENWRTIPENALFAEGAEGVRYDDPSLITPMRFGGDPSPGFLPLIPRDTIDPRKDSYNSLLTYYPYTPEFLPEVRGSSDVVYRCTYYHYVMMGSPDTMLFKETKDRAKFKSADWIPAEIKLPKMTGQKKADIIIRVNGEKKEKTVYKLRIAEDYSVPESYVNDNYFALAYPVSAPTDCTLKLNGDKTVTIEIPALEVRGVCSSYYQKVNEPTVARGSFTLTRPGLTITGNITEQTGTSGDYSIYGTIPAGIPGFASTVREDLEYETDPGLGSRYNLLTWTYGAGTGGKFVIHIYENGSVYVSLDIMASCDRYVAAYGLCRWKDTNVAKGEGYYILDPEQPKSMKEQHFDSTAYSFTLRCDA